MSRKKSASHLALDEPCIDIASMIDVCFLLLIYFLATCSITPRESDLELTLPAGETDSDYTPPIPPMAIRIDPQGVIFSGNGAGEQPLDMDPASRELPLLASQLHLYRDAARSAGSEPLVQLNIDAAVSQQRVVDVLNALGGAGIGSVVFTDFL